MSILMIPKVLCIRNITYKVRFASLLYETLLKQSCSLEVIEHIHVVGPSKSKSMFLNFIRVIPDSPSKERSNHGFDPSLRKLSIKI